MDAKLAEHEIGMKDFALDRIRLGLERDALRFPDVLPSADMLDVLHGDRLVCADELTAARDRAVDVFLVVPDEGVRFGVNQGYAPPSDPLLGEREELGGVDDGRFLPPGGECSVADDALGMLSLGALGFGPEVRQVEVGGGIAAGGHESPFKGDDAVIERP